MLLLRANIKKISKKNVLKQIVPFLYTFKSANIIPELQKFKDL